MMSDINHTIIIREILQCMYLHPNPNTNPNPNLNEENEVYKWP